MSEETPNSQEPTNKANDKIQAAKENAKKVASAIMSKVDDLYNKLPLDKINEKLKGKVDVKSSKFKKILCAVVCIVILLALSMCFSSSKKDLVVPEIPYGWHPAHMKFQIAVINAGLFAQDKAFFDAQEVAENRKYLKDFVGLDIREVYNADYVKKTFGEKVLERYNEVLNSKTPQEWEEEAMQRLEIERGFLRTVQCILDNVVVEANKELASRDNPNTIKRVKFLETDKSVDFHGIGDTYQDNWRGEFIVEDFQGREFDKVFFACNVSWDTKKAITGHPRRCGNAPLTFTLIWFGTNQMNDNWMSSGY